MDKLQAFLTEHRFNVNPILDGKVHRFDREGELSGWLCGYEVRASSGRTVAVVKCGDWKSNERYDFQDDEGLTDTERAEFTLARRESEKKLKAEVEHAQVTTAALCEKLWAIAHGPNGHVSEYLQRKKINGFHGAKTIKTEEYREFILKETGREIPIPDGYVNLLVPACDITGRLWGVQRIQPNGEKGFFPGQRVQGVFHLLGAELAELATRELVYVAEGFATAASIHLATGQPTVSAFNAGNLAEVSKALREKFPNIRITICGDDDAFTQIGGKPRNPGREYATQAAGPAGARVTYPSFKSLDGKPTDFNDLHAREGLEEVVRQLKEFEENRPDLIPLPGKMTPSKHQTVASALAKFYGEKIICQDRDLFVYTGTHWKCAGIADTDRIRCQLQILFGGMATAGQVDSAFRLFTMMLEHVPEGVNLYTPPPWVANFRNGSLHIVKKSRTYQLEFRPHSPMDWIINVLPYDYRPDDKAENAEFLRMLERVFEGDTDKAEKIRALRQMYGACLIAAFPHLFMLHGAPGTGKSTAIILASRLVHSDNTCSVDPTEFESFNLESMAGKLVNWDTDIEMHKPISEKQIKKIIDRLPFRIRRKGIKDIYAPIPAIHIFGGNDIPKTLDGASRAHDRRWTFIGFDRVLTKTADYDVDYATFCFEQGPTGILNFALAGLQDLLDSAGHFTVPTSGKEKMEDWQLQTDPLGQFLRDLDQGQVLDNNVQMKRGPTYRVKQAQLWTVFKAWHLEVHSAEPRLTRFRFYASLRTRGFPSVTIQGFDHFAGIGTFEVENSQF